MELSDAVRLIDSPFLHEKTGPAHWADLGAGTGFFSRALGSLLPEGSVIEAVDRSGFPRLSDAPAGVRIIPRQFDFEKDDWGFRDLDGLLFANSLHYIKEKAAFFHRILGRLKKGGLILLVEYDTERPVTRWVPYPLSYATALSLFRELGYPVVQKLGERPSLFREDPIYAAIIKY